MSALQRLREKLNRPTSDVDCRFDSTGDHTGTANFTERTAWVDRIHKNGNRPGEWLELMKHMKEAMHYTNDKTRQLSVSNMFAVALRSVSEDDKKTEDYALLMIQFAQFRGQYSVEDAREMYQDVRYEAKKHAVSHVAAAQFELDCGNRSKAIKILQKGQSLQAQPVELMRTAFTNLMYGKTQLVTDDEERLIRANFGADKENMLVENDTDSSGEKPVSGRISESSDDGQSNTQPARQQPVKPSLIMPRQTECLSDTDTAPMVERDSSRVSPKKNPLQSLDDNSGYLLKLPGENQVDKCEKVKGLRSYHSTPDCKQSSFLLVSSKKSSTKKDTFLSRRNLGLVRDIGKPMRVPCKRTSLPQVYEGKSEADDSFKLEPLPEMMPEAFHDSRLPRERVESDSGIVSNATCTMSTSSLTSAAGDLGTREADGSGVAGECYSMLDASGVAGNSTLRSQTLPTATPKTLQNEGTNNDTGREGGGGGRVSAETRPRSNKGESCSEGVRDPRDQSVQQHCVNSSSKSVDTSSNIQQPSGAQYGVPEKTPTPILAAPPAPSMAAPVVTGMAVQPQLLQPQVQQLQQQPFLTPVNMAPVTPVNNPSNVLHIKGNFYTVLSLMGRGGSSKVYTVLDSRHRLLAVKCVDLNCADDSTIESYKNEIELLQRLQYSNAIVKLHDSEYSEETNMLYLVMEKGDTDLSTFFKSRSKTGQLTANTLSFYWEQMLTAVQVLHKEGIVHSDLKPANFLLVAGNLKLIDFGIAKAIGDVTSATRDLQVGTLNYMSPEALQDTCCGTHVDEQGRVKPRFKIGVKSDVWSLGCILYNLVYGKTPFQHISSQIMKLQAITNPNVPIDFPPHKNEKLVKVLKSCLQRDPKLRPSIEELLEESLHVQRA